MHHALLYLRTIDIFIYNKKEVTVEARLLIKCNVPLKSAKLRDTRDCHSASLINWGHMHYEGGKNMTKNFRTFYTFIPAKT